MWHVAADLAPPQAEALVHHAVDTVAAVATHRLRDLLAEVEGVETVGVLVGDHPVPESVSAGLASHLLMHAAEGRFYRDALLDAAAVLGLRGAGLPRKQVESRLAGDLAGVIRALGAKAGPPWRKEHKLAAVAALLAWEV